MEPHVGGSIQAQTNWQYRLKIYPKLGNIFIFFNRLHLFSGSPSRKVVTLVFTRLRLMLVNLFQQFTRIEMSRQLNLAASPTHFLDSELSKYPSLLKVIRCLKNLTFSFTFFPFYLTGILHEQQCELHLCSYSPTVGSLTYCGGHASAYTSLLNS